MTYPDSLVETILSVWPFSEPPNVYESIAIEETFHELSLHEPTITESRRWHLAGQIVARLRREGVGP